MTSWYSRCYERNCFEAVTDLIESPKFVSMRKEILKDLKADDSILEVGPGSGLNFPHYPPAVTAITAVALGPDPSPRAVAKAKQRDLNLEYRQGDGRTLPFPDATFDVVVSTLILCTVDEPRGFLSEVWRVLKPGGAFASFEHAYLAPEDGGSAWGCLLVRLFNPLNKAITLGCDQTRPFPRDVIATVGFRVAWQKEECRPLAGVKFFYGVLSKSALPPSTKGDTGPSAEAAVGDEGG